MKRLIVILILAGLAAVPMFAQQGRWEIVRADYGSGNNWVDVTERVRSLAQGDSLNITVDGTLLGQAQRRGRNRSLRLQLRDSAGKERQVIYRDNQRVRLQVNNAYPAGLRINRAIYAYGNRSLDVTSRLNSQISGDQLNLQVNNQSMGGDPAPGQDKTLTVDYSIDGQVLQAVIREVDSLHLTHANTNQSLLQITRATYGTAYRSADVTSRLNSQIQGNQLALQVNSNTVGSDPAPGQSKTLNVQYSLNGMTNQIMVRDGDMLRLNSSGSQSGLGIDRATYGSGYRSADVTSRLNSQTQGNQLTLQVNSNTMGTISGTRYTVSTGDLEPPGGQGVGANRRTAIMVGGGAAIGTIIGAIVGGGKGAAIGAAIGAGGGLGTEILTKGKQVKVPAETLLSFKLDQDLRLQAAR